MVVIIDGTAPTTNNPNNPNNQHTHTMKTIEEIHDDIIQEAQTAFELSIGGDSYYSLILTSDGELYWDESTDGLSCSVAVWEGRDVRLMCFRGWYPEVDAEYYEQIEATPDEAAAINKAIAQNPEYYATETEIEVGGEFFRRGETCYGFDPEKWYKSGELITDNPEMWPSMEDAMEVAEKFWEAKNSEQ